MMRQVPTLVALALLAACPPSPGEGAPAPAPEATWAAVRPADDATALEVPARAVAGPDTSAVVSPPLSGTIVRVRARAGDAVNAGAPLIDVVMPGLLEATGRLEGARVRLQAWTERHAQLTQLKTEGLARSLDVSEAAARVAEAKADLQAARAIILSAGVREAEAAAVLAGSGALPLRAPQAGVVTRVAATLGEHREPGSGPLLELASEGPVRIEARFSQRAPDGRYEFLSAAGAAPLSLVSRAPSADARDGTFLTWFETSAPVAPGTLGRVVLRSTDASGLVRVVATAITRLEGAAQVETRRGPVPVAVVRCEAVDCVVRGALQPGDEVRAR